MESTSKRSAVVDTIAGTIASAIGRVIEHPLNSITVKMQAAFMRSATTTTTTTATANSAATTSSSSTTATASGFGSSAQNVTNTTTTTASTTATTASPRKSARKAGTVQKNKKKNVIATSTTETTANNNAKKKQTCRVRANPPTVTVRSCAQDIYKQHGMKGFYRGLAFPLLGSMVEGSVAFTTYHQSLGLVGAASSALSSAFGADSSPEPKSTEIQQQQQQQQAAKPLSHVIVAGAAAGVATSLVLTPTELVKCRMQLQTPRSRIKYKNSIDCAIRTWQLEGARAFTRGFGATLARECPGNAAWFASYQLCLLHIFGGAPNNSGSNTALPWYAVPISGAFAGAAYSLAFYPADVCKTFIQTDKKFARLSFGEALRRLYVRGGIRGMYCGGGLAAVRAIPSNAAIFSVYELVTSCF